MNTRTIKAVKNVVFVMNENNKTELIEWSYFNRELLLPHIITATAAAGKILEGTLNKPVNKLVSGPRGEYKQLADMITEGKVDVMVFFGTGSETLFRPNEFEALIATARENNIIIALNRSTADFVFSSLHINKDYSIEPPVSENQKKEVPLSKQERVQDCGAVEAA